MAYLCQDDFARVRSGDYFPSPDIGNGRDCDACGAQTWHAARVTADEAETARREYASEVVTTVDDGALRIWLDDADPVISGLAIDEMGRRNITRNALRGA